VDVSSAWTDLAPGTAAGLRDPALAAPADPFAVHNIVAMNPTEMATVKLDRMVMIIRMPPLL
jgi:hypothetical protein